MARTEFFNEPEAPKANSIVVAVTVFVVDDEDRVLLIRRTDNGLWAVPGGVQYFGEYIAETAVRETRGIRRALRHGMTEKGNCPCRPLSRGALPAQPDRTSTATRLTGTACTCAAPALIASTSLTRASAFDIATRVAARRRA